MWLTYYEFYLTSGEDNLFYSNIQFFPIVVSSVCVFLFVSTLEFSRKVEKIVLKIGSLTFGIYLISDLILNLLRTTYTGLVSLGLYEMIAMVIYQMTIFGAGAVVVYFIKKIPIINRFI